MYTRRSFGRRPTVRRLSRMVYKLRNVVDPDTTFNEQSDFFSFDSRDSTFLGGVEIPNVNVNFKDLSPELEALRTSGNRYRLKSVNERIIISSTNGTSNTTLPDDSSLRRRVRIMYVLAKDEPLVGLESIFNT